MKILLTNFHPYDGGGHTTYLLSLYRILNRDHTIFLACPPTSRLYTVAQEVCSDNVVGIDFPGKPKELLDIIKNLKKVIGLIKVESFDIIHVNGSPDHRMIMYAKMLLHDHTPLVKTIHNSLSPRTNLYTKMREKYFTDKTIVVSDYQKQVLFDSGYTDDEVTTIHNGVDTDYFIPVAPSEDMMRKYGIRDSDIVFVSVAGLDLYKGWHLLVEAVAGLDETLRKRIKIVLAGKTPGKETRAKYIDRFGMKNHVFFTGLLSDVRDVISIADAGFVLSYKIEAMPFSCREMMSMGKPVLVSDYAGLPENIDDGINGWIAESLNVNSIKGRIVEICAGLDKLDRFSMEARKKAEKEFGLNTFIDKTFSCYESVLSSDRKL